MCLLNFSFIFCYLVMSVSYLEPNVHRTSVNHLSKTNTLIWLVNVRVGSCSRDIVVDHGKDISTKPTLDTASDDSKLLSLGL